MNHILQKQADIFRLEQEKRNALAAIVNLRVHLCSEKFHKDTTIQVSDVHHWLDVIVAELK